MLPREKGRRSHSITASKLTRGIVPKLVRQHILLILIVRMSDPGAPSNSLEEAVALIGAWKLKAFRRLENPIIQL